MLDRTFAAVLLVAGLLADGAAGSEIEEAYFIVKPLVLQELIDEGYYQGENSPSESFLGSCGDYDEHEVSPLANDLKNLAGAIYTAKGVMRHFPKALWRQHLVAFEERILEGIERKYVDGDTVDIDTLLDLERFRFANEINMQVTSQKLDLPWVNPGPDGCGGGSPVFIRFVVADGERVQFMDYTLFVVCQKLGERSPEGICAWTDYAGGADGQAVKPGYIAARVASRPSEVRKLSIGLLSERSEFIEYKFQ